MGKLAIVLSGGGARGAYEMGVWKALKRMHVKYDIVTGTSIGSINGLLMVQKTYKKEAQFVGPLSIGALFGDLISRDNLVLKVFRNFFVVIELTVEVTIRLGQGLKLGRVVNDFGFWDVGFDDL